MAAGSATQWKTAPRVVAARTVIQSIDKRAPSVPPSLGVAAVSTTTISVTWGASRDDVGVAGYGIYLNGTRLATTTARSYTFPALTCGRTYKVGVDAFDAARHRSGIASVLAATAPCVDRTAPSAPGNVHQSGWSQTGLAVEWSESSDNVGVAGYSIYRDGVPVAATQQPTAWVGGLVCGAAHTISVEAYDAAGNPSPRASAVGTTTACADTSPPAAPHNLSVSGSTESSISVAWQPSVDDRGVAEYRLSVNDVDIRTTTATAATFTGLACSRSYVVKVGAADAAGNVSPSSSVIAPTAVCPTSGGSADTQTPTSPSSLVRRDGTATSITLSWNASTDNVGVAGYGIYRGTTKVGDSGVNAYGVEGLACATSYTLSVDAVDAAGNRSTRATIVASTDPCQDTQAPTAPAGIVAQARTETSITLSWQASSDAGGVAGYRVFRDGALAGSTNSTSYTVAGLSCGKSYTFGLEAFDPSANHSARTATIFSTAACSDTVAPSAPASFVKTGATTTSIAVSWSPASDNVAVAGYALSVAGSAIGTTAQPSYTFSGLACGTSYALGIEAYDAAGNRSPRITLQADAAACASSPPTPPPSPPPSQGLANVFAVPPTSTDGSTNCVRSATPKTYEQALAASPKNVCAYVAGVKTSWDMACNAATAGDLVGVRPGVYETVGDGGYLLGSNEIGQDCSDGLGADVNPNAKEQAVSTGTTAAWVKFVPAVPCNGVPNISFKYMPGVLSMANGNWHLIVEGDCFNFNRTIYIHDRNDNFGPSGRPSNLIIRGESQTRLQQWYGIEVLGGRNMLFENIDQGPNVQCAANDANATPVYFRCLPPELGGAFFEAPYATSGTNAPGCNPNETDLCAGFFPSRRRQSRSNHISTAAPATAPTATFGCRPTTCTTGRRRAPARASTRAASCSTATRATATCRRTTWSSTASAANVR